MMATNKKEKEKAYHHKDGRRKRKVEYEIENIG